MATNFLPVRRELQEHWIYKDSCFLHGWMEMLFNARYSNEPKTDMYKGVLYTLNRGEFLFSRVTYAERLKMSEGKMQHLVKMLLDEKMIEVTTSLGKNKPTIYRICNYNKYNCATSETVDIKGLEEELEQMGIESQSSGNQVGIESASLKKNVKKERKVIKFIPPTIEEVSAYIKEKDYSVDPKRFFDYFEAGEWHDSEGKRVNNWKQKIITWNKREESKQKPQQKHPHAVQAADPIRIERSKAWD